MACFEVRVLADALARALVHKDGVGWRVLVVDLGEEAVECEVSSLLAAGVLLAEVAADSADAADLGDLGSANGVVAENVDGGLSGNKLDELAWADGHALAAADAEALVDDCKAVLDANGVLGADVRARAVS